MVDMRAFSATLDRSFVANLLKVQRLLASGSSLHRNQVLKEHIKRVFKMKVEPRLSADAHFGAALAAEELLN